MLKVEELRALDECQAQRKRKPLRNPHGPGRRLSYPRRSAQGDPYGGESGVRLNGHQGDVGR